MAASVETSVYLLDLADNAHARRSARRPPKTSACDAGTVEIRPRNLETTAATIEAAFAGLPVLGRCTTPPTASAVHPMIDAGGAGFEREARMPRNEVLLSRTLKERGNSESGPDVLGRWNFGAV